MCHAMSVQSNLKQSQSDKSSLLQFSRIGMEMQTYLGLPLPHLLKANRLIIVDSILYSMRSFGQLTSMQECVQQSVIEIFRIWKC